MSLHVAQAGSHYRHCKFIASQTSSEAQEFAEAMEIQTKKIAILYMILLYLLNLKIWIK